jgi:hypothetical protein
MADPPTYPGHGSASDDTSAGHDDGRAPRPRRRIILIWAIVAALLLLVIILHITGTLGPGTGA